MTQYRNDDVAALIAEAETAATGAKRPKVRQRWMGTVAARTRPKQGAALRDALDTKTPKTWFHVALAHGDNWISLTTEYTAKGANADDAEKLVRRLADKVGVALEQVAVSTSGVHVLGDV